MAVAPQSLWFERFEQIGRIIEQDAESITERWARAVDGERDERGRAHYATMRDHIPALLQVMGRALAHSENSIPAAHTMLALEHGEQRWHVGWRLTDVIQDYQVLRLVILEYLDEKLDKPLALRETMAIGLAMDESITASVVAYVGFQESQLRDANRRLTDFLSVLGHELRNPLSAAVTAIEIVRMPQVDDSTLREVTALIDRQLQQLSRLLNDMSDVSRIIRGRLDLRPSRIDLRTAVEEGIESVQSYVAEQQHRLSFDLGDEPLWINGDPARLRQVVANLVHNAAKYSRPESQIIVETRHRDGQAVLRIQDTGIGISESQLPHIFEMFSQANTNQPQGLGIGLALVRALVEMHCGTVTAHSQGLGHGSEFVVELPLLLDDRTRSEPLPAVDEPAVGSPIPLRVLLVDDHVDSARTFAELLRRFHYEVKVVYDAPTALTQIEREVPDAILIDIGLPGMNGYELARLLRLEPRLNRVPFVAITGFAGDEARDRASAAGFVAHLSKPVDIKAVQKLLESLVAPR